MRDLVVGEGVLGLADGTESWSFEGPFYAQRNRVDAKLRDLEAIEFHQLLTCLEVADQEPVAAQGLLRGRCWRSRRVGWQAECALEVIRLRRAMYAEELQLHWELVGTLPEVVWLDAEARRLEHDESAFPLVIEVNREAWLLIELEERDRLVGL